MPPEFSVVAIIAAYNEADVIASVVRDLIDQGISVYFLDDGSTDGTIEAVEPYAGRGVIGIERLPSGRAGLFTWERILGRKAQLASEIDADWFIHHDADEFRESPWAGVPLKDAIQRVDALGYNAIDFASLDFRPTHDRFRAGDDARAAFPFYSESAAYDKVQIRCWKKTDRVDLASTGGHDARFEGRKVFPVRFLLRHYPIRGQSHGERKVFAERQPRFVEEERARGWHVQYDSYVEGTSFVHDPCTLTRFDPVDVRIGLSLRHRGVETLEQSLEGLRSEIEARTNDLEARTKDLEARTADIQRLQAELRTRSAESDERGQRLERLGVELENTHAQLKAVDSELTETRAQVAHRTSELAARRDEIAGLNGEIAGLNHKVAGLNGEIAGLNGQVRGLNRALEHRKIEVDNFQASVADLLKQLDAFRRSLSWRWTAPARAVYRLLTGR